MPNFWKVVNSVIVRSDIILVVLDARLVDETRNPEIEKKVKLNDKILLFVINKCDLVSKSKMDEIKKKLKPSVFISTKEHHGTTMLKKKIMELGKGESIIVGVVGYPNTGKSSVINVLAGRKKAMTSPQSGFTKGAQLVKAGSKIKFLDSPGVIPFMEADTIKHALISTVDAAKIKDPEFAADVIIERFPVETKKHYKLDPDIAAEDVLEEIAVSKNKLKKGGLPDTMLAARMVIMDWQRGRISLLD